MTRKRFASVWDAIEDSAAEAAVMTPKRTAYA